MKKLFFLLLYSQSFWTSLDAQPASAYLVFPNPSDTVSALDVLHTPAFARVKNITADSVFIKWERHIIYLTSGVVTAVCDPVRCWYVLTNSNSFGLASDSVGELTVHFDNTLGQVASGIVHLKLTNLDNPADTLTAVYTYNTLSGTLNLPEPNVKLFPNPATDFFSLANAEAVAYMKLYALDGRVVASYRHSAGHTYSIENLPPGNYVLSFEDKNRQLFQAAEFLKQ